MGLMNYYARLGMEFFEMMMKVFEFFQYVLLRLFNNNVLLIKQIDTNNAVSYAVPALGMVFCQGCLPRFYSENEVLPLMFVYHVKNCEMHSMICKDRCMIDVNISITFLDEKIMKEISKKYMFVELGCENITATFKKIAWCFLEVEFTVSDLKRLMSHQSKAKDTLILTDSDMNMTEFEKDEDVIKL
jgi:hypothetical protein